MPQISLHACIGVYIDSHHIPPPPHTHNTQITTHNTQHTTHNTQQLELERDLKKMLQQKFLTREELVDKVMNTVCVCERECV